MAEPKYDSRNKVSLEELLRFKRAERPDQDFWKEFDGELHQRMMRTLVKKDPWPVQLLRALSGKFVQTAAISAAAAILALLAIRPAFVAPVESHQPEVAQMDVEKSDRVERSAGGLDPELMGNLAEPDYKIEVVSAAATAGSKDSVTQDYGLDHIDVASYDKSAYSADMALSGFTSTGVASLVY